MLESVKIQKFGQKYYENYHIFDYLILSKLSSISISIMMIHFYPHFPLLSQLSTNYLDYLLLLQTERLYRVYILHLFSSGNSVPETVFREQWFRIGCITWFKLSLPLKVWSHFQRWLSNAKESTHHPPTHRNSKMLITLPFFLEMDWNLAWWLSRWYGPSLEPKKI